MREGRGGGVLISMGDVGCAERRVGARAWSGGSRGSSERSDERLIRDPATSNRTWLTLVVLGDGDYGLAGSTRSYSMG